MRVQPSTNSFMGIFILLIVVVLALLFMFAPIDKTLETAGYILTHNSIFTFVTSSELTIVLPIILLLAGFLWILVLISRQ